MYVRARSGPPNDSLEDDVDEDGDRIPTPPSPTAPVHTSLAQSLDNVDRRDIVRRIFLSAPSLQHVSFRMEWQSAGTKASGLVEMRKSDLPLAQGGEGSDRVDTD